MTIRPLDAIAAEFKATIAELEEAINCEREGRQELSRRVIDARHRADTLRAELLAAANGEDLEAMSRRWQRNEVVLMDPNFGMGPVKFGPSA